MKKSILVSAMMLCVYLFLSPSSKAQSPTGLNTIFSLASAKFFSAHVAINESEVDARALKSFNKKFSPQVEVLWHKDNEDYRAYFVESGIQHRITYNRKGKWVQTIKSYLPEHLDANVRDLVEETYDGYEIIGITEVQISSYQVYFVNVASRKKFKELVVYKNEITVRNQFNIQQ